ncbi:hypothetical protein QQ045_001488 [Rhodiola kirilowii]
MSSTKRSRKQNPVPFIRDEDDDTNLRSKAAKIHQQEEKLISPNISSKILKEASDQQKEIEDDEKRERNPNFKLIEEQVLVEPEEDMDEFAGFEENKSFYDCEYNLRGSFVNKISSIESKSSHPMAPALVDYSDSIESKLSYLGEEIHGKSDGQDVYIGNRRMARRAHCESDDVIIFSKASQSSMLKMKEVLDVFHSWSGLSVNSNKSAIFFGGVSDRECNILYANMGFSRGKFPFNYLGIPMDSKALRRESYNVPIENMTRKIQSWAATCLSYVGRLVLVKHVLSMISSYWMRVLPLPKVVLKKLNTICRSYLWAGLPSSKKSLIAWITVCLSKDHGGLGVKNLLIFNKALLLGQVWDLCLKKDAFWIKWMNNYYFRNQSLWEVVERNHHTWGLKKMLRLRSNAMHCVHKGAYEILADKGTSEWWTALVWNFLSLPKHSFCTWFAIMNRLQMKVRVKDAVLGDVWCGSLQIFPKLPSKNFVKITAQEDAAENKTTHFRVRSVT